MNRKVEKSATETTPLMTDQTFLEAFTQCTLPEASWTHEAHVRAAYLFADQLDWPEALTEMRIRIQAYNAATGTPEAIDRGYHETITQAFMRLIFAACRQGGPWETAAEFMAGHPELMTKKALRRYYSRELIMSWEAKRGFVAPDLQPLPSFAGEN